MRAIDTLDLGLRLVFYPNSLDVQAEPVVKTRGGNKHVRLKSDWVGTLLGLIGFLLIGAYIFPESQIKFTNFQNPSTELILNKTVGAVMGFLLLLFLFIFERLLVHILGLQEYRSERKMSRAMFVLMPLINIPIHAIFNDQLSARGHYWIVFTLVVIYLGWHAWLFYLLIPDREKTTKRTRNCVLVFFIVELTCAVLFLTLAPIGFQTTAIKFLEAFF